jgi:hypothetical protein
MNGKKVFQDMVDQLIAREDYLNLNDDYAAGTESDDCWLASDCMPGTGDYEDDGEPF